MSWTSGTYYGFDLETTGVDVHTDRIVTATVVKIEGGKHVGSREWLIDPQVEIPEGAQNVHGITTEHARENGMAPMVGLSEIADTVGRVLRGRYPLAVMNAAYDMSMLTAELRRWALPTLDAWTEDWSSLVDPLVLAKGLDTINRAHRKGRTYKLPDLCARYGVEFTETHNSTADAVGAALVAAAIVDSDEDLAAKGPKAIFTAQQTWRRHDQQRFAEWVRSSGNESKYGDIDPGWPLHTRLTEQAVSA